MLNIDTSIDLKQCLLWQYNNSTTLKSLIQAKQDWYKENQEKFWNDWYTNIFNIDTANSFGLNVWGEILNFKRAIKDKKGNLHFLTDKQYRLVLKGQMIKFGMGASAYDVNKWLQLVFKDYGQVYCVDKGNMEAIPFVFRADPSQEILWLLGNVDFIPRPAGVGYEIHIIPTTTFGFNGSGLMPFNQGVFANDYSEEIAIQDDKNQLTINAPKGARVKINGQYTDYALLGLNEYYNYSIERDGFLTYTGEGVNLGNDISISIAEFIINRDFSNGNVFINNQNAIGAYFLKGQRFDYTYSIGEENYLPYTETRYSYDDDSVSLSKFEINTTPIDASVKINGQSAKGAFFNTGVDFNYSYEVSKDGFANIKNSGTTNQTQVLDIKLESAYQPDEVVFESSTAGNYSLDVLATGRYEIAVVGGGGGGYLPIQGASWNVSGGSGSCFVGEVLISKGNYNLQIGAGGQRGQNGSNTSIENICTAYGGNFGTTRTGGAGGAIPTIYTTIYTSSINSVGKSVGNQANVNAGSLYNGYGAGTTSNGTNGYIRIIYKGA